MTDMSPIGWALRPLKKYATFSGRAPRAEFWWFILLMAVAYLAMWFVLMAVVGGLAASQSEPSMGMIGAFGAAGIFMVLFWLALIVPTLAVQTRRLHDTNRSGWWLAGFYLLYALYIVVTMSAAFAAEEGGMAMLGGAMLFGLAFLGYTIVLLVFYCLPGTKGPNRYGHDPYGADLDEVFA